MGTNVRLVDSGTTEEETLQRRLLRELDVFLESDCNVLYWRKDPDYPRWKLWIARVFALLQVVYMGLDIGNVMSSLHKTNDGVDEQIFS